MKEEIEYMTVNFFPDTGKRYNKQRFFVKILESLNRLHIFLIL